MVDDIVLTDTSTITTLWCLEATSKELVTDLYRLRVKPLSVSASSIRAVASNEYQQIHQIPTPRANNYKQIVYQIFKCEITGLKPRV